MSSAYTVLVCRNGERRYTHLPSEDDVCSFVLSMYEQECVSRMEGEAKGGRKPPEVIQYTASDVLDFIDLNLSELVVLAAVTSANSTDKKTKATLYESHGTDWVKSAVCRFLEKQLAADEAVDDDSP